MASERACSKLYRRWADADDRRSMQEVAASWHMHLDILVARATGKEPEPFWDSWSRLKQ